MEKSTGAAKQRIETSSPKRLGTGICPAEHVRLENVLFAPIVIEGTVLGLLGLANKPGGFDRSDARVAATFGELAAIGLRNSRTMGLLEASEAELSTILANVPVLTLLVDRSRRVLKANKAAAALAGRADGMAELIVGEALRCIGSADDPRGCGFGSGCQTCGLRLAAIDTYENGNPHYEVEWRYRPRFDGKLEEMTFLASTVPVDKPTKQVLVCFEDITERKKAEKTLAESEQRYHGVFEHMSEAMVLGEMILDRDGNPYDFRILDCNRPWAELVGRDIDDIKGKTRREVLAVKDPFWMQTLGSVALTGRPEHFERFSTAMGKWLEVRAFSPAKGQFVELLSDVTEGKGPRDRLAYLASFPEMNPNPIVELDESGKAEYLSPASQRLFSTLAEEKTGHAFLVDWESVVTRLRLGKAAVVRRDVRVGELWYEQVVTYLPARQTYRIYARDISERKQMEDIKDEFIGMVSHELKTPLTVVTGAINTVLSGGINPEDARQLMEDAAWGAEVMADIVDNLLELSRWQQQRLVLQTARVNIGKTVRRWSSNRQRSPVDIASWRQASRRRFPEIHADQTRINAYWITL